MKTLLTIVNLSSGDSAFPTDALPAIDSALAILGLRKQVRSVVVPGKEYSITYDGPTAEKSKVEGIVTKLAKEHHLSFTVEIEESVSFP